MNDFQIVQRAIEEEISPYSLDGGKMIGRFIKAVHDYSRVSGVDRDWRSGSKDYPTDADKKADKKINEFKKELLSDLKEMGRSKGYPVDEDEVFSDTNDSPNSFNPQDPDAHLFLALDPDD